MKTCVTKSRGATLSLTHTVIALTLMCGLAGCTRPKQTTAIGSGVGGAIGAGLGAIVGNQSGNAGSGVAIGAAAGAATGALIGNALQAQEEKNASTQEALKRQDRTILAQKNEIAELRAMQSDTSVSYSSYDGATPRYRYRQPSTAADSPEVARQRAKLQQRGPRPAGSSSPDTYYEPSLRAPRFAPKTAITVKDGGEYSAGSHKPLARYDVRSELTDKTSPSSTTPSQTASSASSKKMIAKAPPPIRDAGSASTTTSSKSIAESDLPIADTTTTKLSEPASANSRECKEAFGERDLANEASDSSDKLYHLRRALRLCPGSAPLHYELGKVYGSMERVADAEAEYKQALSIDPKFSAATKAMGELLKNETQY